MRKESSGQASWGLSKGSVTLIFDSKRKRHVSAIQERVARVPHAPVLRAFSLTMTLLIASHIDRGSSIAPTVLNLWSELVDGDDEAIQYTGLLNLGFSL